MTESTAARRVIDELLAGSAIQLPDADHAVRCAAFAASLFDDLHQLLELDPDDRRLAMVAALYHDSGYLRSGRDHHRKSFDVIREANIPGLTDHGRLLAGLAARYHGHTAPNIEHAGFGDLPPGEQRRARRLSAIVRVAVALDASHLGAVDDARVVVNNGAVELTIMSEAEPAVERERVREAAGGFTALTQVPMRTRVEIVDRETKVDNVRCQPR